MAESVPFNGSASGVTAWGGPVFAGRRSPYLRNTKSRDSSILTSDSTMQTEKGHKTNANVALVDEGGFWRRPWPDPHRTK